MAPDRFAAERRARDVAGPWTNLLAAAHAVLHQLERGEASDGDPRDIAWCARTLREAIDEAEERAEASSREAARG